MSNSYTITDDPDIWKSETSDELSEEISKQELEEMAELLRAAGYTIQSPTEQTVSNSQAAYKNSYRFQIHLTPRKLYLLKM